MEHNNTIRTPEQEINYLKGRVTKLTQLNQHKSELIQQHIRKLIWTRNKIDQILTNLYINPVNTPKHKIKKVTQKQVKEYIKRRMETYQNETNQ